MMDYLLPIFKTVSLVFAIASVATGAQAIVDPIGFSNNFGLPLSPITINTAASLVDNNDADASTMTIVPPSYQHHLNISMSYVSLMGIRQLATGIVLLTFAYQHKWTEMATILAIIGIVVAGTDGIFLSRAGARGLAQFHAVPGALIAALAFGVVYSNAKLGGVVASEAEFVT